jgi:hypothetical protein
LCSRRASERVSEYDVTIWRGHDVAKSRCFDGDFHTIVMFGKRRALGWTDEGVFGCISVGIAMRQPGGGTFESTTIDCSPHVLSHDC